MRGFPKVGFFLLGLLAMDACAGGIFARQADLPTAYYSGTPSNVYQDGTNQYTLRDTTGHAFEKQMSTSSSFQYGSTTNEFQQWSIERLPPVDVTMPQTVGPTPKYGQDFPGGLLLPDDDVVEQQQSAAKGLPPGMRRAGCFQMISLGGSWLATGTGRDALGVAESSVSCEFVLPSLIPQSFLTIKPKYGIHRFDHPGNYDIPNEVHDAAVGFGMRGRLSERLSFQTNVTVGSYSDFENESGDQVRVRGYGSGMWKWNEKVDLTFGIAYVDLQDWPVLPIGGFIIRPDETRVVHVTFPRMAYSRRLCIAGTCGRPVEYWGTLGLEMGGGRWIVETNTGSTEDMTYSDWRLVLGLQQKRVESYDLNFSIGYVFGRRIEYDNEHESFAPDDTFSLTLTGQF